MARQEPRLRWAVAERADGTTVLATDLASGWIPPGVELPASVQLLPPAKRHGDLTAMLGETEAVAAFTPGHYVSTEEPEQVNVSSRPRKTDPVDELHVDRDTSCVFGDEVVEERKAALDRVGHLHAVGEEGQDEVREMDPRPEVERLVQRIAAREPLVDRQPRERELAAVCSPQPQRGRGGFMTASARSSAHAWRLQRRKNAARRALLRRLTWTGPA